MRRNLTILLAWVAATLVALGAASAAVRVVADQVAADLPPPLPADLRATPADVVAAAPSLSPTSPAPAEPSESPSVATGVATAAPSTPPRPVVSAPPSSPSPSATPAPETPAPAASETRTVHVVGGSTALRFETGTVTVVWATPNAGFTVTIEGSDTAEARIRFRSEDHRSEVKGSYADGQIDVDIEEEDDDHSGSSDDDGSDDD